MLRRRDKGERFGYQPPAAKPRVYAALRERGFFIPRRHKTTHRPGRQRRVRARDTTEKYRDQASRDRRLR